MKNVLAIFSMLLIVSCATPPPLEPGSDIWQYDDDKFVSFKEGLTMSWEYDDPSIGCFEIDREFRKLSETDKQKITKFVKEKNEKKLIEIVNTRYKVKKFEGDAIKYPAKDEREFTDKEIPLPKFGNIYYYRLYALEECDSQITTQIKSDHVDISVIIMRQ